jgi:hypothetical protein
MKKVILAMVFIFATGTIMNASSSKEEITAPITRTLEKANDCFSEAWEYGTVMGKSDYGEWFYMNEYYEAHCG